MNLWWELYLTRRVSTCGLQKLLRQASLSWMANKEQTPTDASCMLRSLGGELGDFLGLVLVWSLCVLWCSLFPFQFGLASANRLQGVKTLQPQLHLWVSRGSVIPQAGYAIWEQSKGAKSRGKAELPWETRMRHFSWLSWRHVTPQPPLKNSADGIGEKKY